ncbi:MAG: TetR/AcrR family transcriptional regulator [Bifidobacteriaceae bacterium]|jgi:AcrR family transcriptional regulator|nr:TetR/AcrR family transcriptional regulator [Bifidobacteriaceae bacterium]
MSAEDSLPVPSDSTLERESLNYAVTRRGEHIREETNRKIARATLQIALSEGTKAVTIEEVSRRSGVAKTTIYRRFSNSEELLTHISLLDALPPLEVDHLAPTRQNLELLIRTAVDFFDTTVGVKSVGMILSSDSAFFKQVFDHLVVPVRNEVAEFFENGIRQKAFTPDTDTDFILEQIIGSVVAHVAVHGTVAQTWIQKMATFLWQGIAVPRLLESPVASA